MGKHLNGWRIQMEPSSGRWWLAKRFTLPQGGESWKFYEVEPTQIVLHRPPWHPANAESSLLEASIRKPE